LFVGRQADAIAGYDKINDVIEVAIVKAAWQVVEPVVD
jgi:hypothetical protein